MTLPNRNLVYNLYQDIEEVQMKIIYEDGFNFMSSNHESFYSTNRTLKDPFVVTLTLNKHHTFPNFDR